MIHVDIPGRAAPAIQNGEEGSDPEERIYIELPPDMQYRMEEQGKAESGPQRLQDSAQRKRSDCAHWVFALSENCGNEDYEHWSG